MLVYLTLCTFLFKLYVTSKVTWLFWCIWAWVWPDLHRLQWVYLHADAHYSKFVALYVSIGARGQMYVWTNLLLRSFALSFFLPFFLSFFRLFASSADAGMVLCYLFFFGWCRFRSSGWSYGDYDDFTFRYFHCSALVCCQFALDLWIYPIVYTFFVFVLHKPFN